MFKALIAFVVVQLRRGAVGYLRQVITAWAARATQRLWSWIVPRLLSVLSMLGGAFRWRVASLLPV